ncbi:tRNA (guanine-N(1)-)-methyltransferase [Candidatus Magnetoovum chiemensis]|nr:tRNA (guanine-N(1)-)-methyltransferase [Candidatus Magnetoovum chiemensis]
MLSIGEYVLTGGELAALIIIDAVSRLVPSVLGSDSSNQDESFTCGLLDYPHYTRPKEFLSMEVPEVLLNGNHQQIRKWRRKQSIKKTLLLKPYMLDNVANLSKEDKMLLNEIKEEIKDELNTIA